MKPWSSGVLAVICVGVEEGVVRSVTVGGWVKGVGIGRNETDNVEFADEDGLYPSSLMQGLVKRPVYLQPLSGGDM